MDAPKFYQSSNRLDGSLAIWLPLLGGGGAAALGVVYAFLSYLICQVFESPSWLVIVTPFFGAGLALVGVGVCTLGKVRQRRVRLPIAIIVGVIGFYVSWHAYINFADELGIQPAPSWTMSPIRLVRGMHQLAQIEGWSSYIWWLLEAAVVFGMLVYMMRSEDDHEVPFCEACDKWTTEAFHFDLGDGTAGVASDKLQHGDLAALAALAQRKAGDDYYVVVRVYACECGKSRYVSVDRARIRRGKRGGVKYGSVVSGSRPKFYVDPGSSDTTEFTPELENLVIDEAQQAQLAALRKS